MPEAEALDTAEAAEPKVAVNWFEPVHCGMPEAEVAKPKVAMN
jgi:hypothetical protein